MNVQTWDGEPITEPGLYRMSYDAYRSQGATDDGFNVAASLLTVADQKSMQHAYRRLKRTDTPASSTAMIVGTQLHTAVFEPEKLMEGCVISPYPDFRPKIARAWRDEQLAAGRKIVKEDEFAEIKEMANAVFSHPVAGPLIESALKEVSAFSKKDGVWTKQRMDFIPAAERVVGDLKTTKDANPKSFSKSIGSYGYAQQAAWYIDGARRLGMDVSRFLYVVVETVPPYLVQIYSLHEGDIELGRKQNEAAFRAILACRESNNWPAYQSGKTPLVVGMPEWARYDAIDNLEASDADPFVS